VQKQPLDEHLLTEYLLGESPESETERLDELSLSDDGFVDQLRAIEDDLVDSYLRGELTADSLSKFNSYYLASPLRREKVKVAKSLLTFTDKVAAGSQVKEPVKAPREKRSLAGFFALPRLTLQWGFAAAALLFLITAGYLAFENVRLRRHIGQTQAERTALEQREQTLKGELETERTNDTAIQQELAQVRERLAQLAQQQSITQPAKPIVVAFALSPQTRGTSQIPNIAVPVEANALALKLDVEATGFPVYQAALKSPATGETIWRSGRLKVNSSDGALRVSVPAKLLKSQNYVLELSGISARGQPDNAGSYSFRIRRS